MSAMNDFSNQESAFKDSLIENLIKKQLEPSLSGKNYNTQKKEEFQSSLTSSIKEFYKDKEFNVEDVKAIISNNVDKSLYKKTALEILQKPSDIFNAVKALISVVRHISFRPLNIKVPEEELSNKIEKVQLAETKDQNTKNQVKNNSKNTNIIGGGFWQNKIKQQTKEHSITR